MDGELDVVQVDLLAAAVLRVNLCLFDHHTYPAEKKTQIASEVTIGEGGKPRDADRATQALVPTTLKRDIRRGALTVYELHQHISPPWVPTPQYPIVAVANIGKRRSAIRGDLGVRGNRRE